jgi:hypothetical protein
MQNSSYKERGGRPTMSGYGYVSQVLQKQKRIPFFAGAVAGGIYYFSPLDKKGTNTLFLYEFAHINS